MLFLNEKNEKSSDITIKGIKNFQGREGYGLICSVYFKNKRVLVFSDFADGACSFDLNYCISGKFADSIKKEFISYVQNSGIAELILKDKNRNKFYNNSIEKIPFDTILNEIIEAKRLLLEVEKKIAKVKKLSIKKIVVSKKDHSSFYFYSWDGISSLADLSHSKSYLNSLQETYDQAKKELLDDEYIVNDLSVLSSIGVVV